MLQPHKLSLGQHHPPISSDAMQMSQHPIGLNLTNQLFETATVHGHSKWRSIALSDFACLCVFNIFLDSFEKSIWSERHETLWFFSPQSICLAQFQGPSTSDSPHPLRGSKNDQNQSNFSIVKNMSLVQRLEGGHPLHSTTSWSLRSKNQVLAVFLFWASLFA